MKKRFYRASIIAIVAGALSLYSCKDYMDIGPQSQFGIEDVFNNLSNANAAVMGVYQMMAGDNGYGQRISLIFPHDTDETSTSGTVTDAGRRGLARYSIEASNTEIERTFNQFYVGIERANIAIKNIPLMEQYSKGTAQEQAELKRLHGEVLTLRAQFYFELVRNWGDLPFQTAPSVAGQDFNLHKTSSDSIYDHLLKDLELAATLVPWTGSSERVTQGAVRGLRARIALFRGGYGLRRDTRTMERRPDYLKYYEIAKNECDTIIKSGIHRLNPSYYNVFKGLNELKLEHGERIWEVAQAGGNSNYDSKLGHYNGPRTNAASRYGGGGGGIIIVPTYFYAFDSLDTRRDVTIAHYEILGDNTRAPRRITEMYDGKFRRDWRVPIIGGTTQTLGINWVLLRYSDVLLMYAEAVNELNGGPTAEAINAFEAVRKRAFAGNTDKIGPTPTDKQGFFEALVKERSLELGAEGIRKYDLIRWNLLGTKLQEAKANMADLRDGKGKYANVPRYLYWKKDGENIVWQYSFYNQNPGVTQPGWTRLDWRQNLGGTNDFIDKLGKFFTPNKSEVLPIHVNIIARNPNLTQDYGY